MTAPSQPSSQPSSPPRDAGMTIAELLVAIGLLMMIGGLLASTAVLTLRSGLEVSTRLTDSTQGSSGASSVARVLRTAVFPAQIETLVCGVCTDSADPAVVYAASDRIDFYANAGGVRGPDKVVLRLENRASESSGLTLVQQTQAPQLLGTTYSYCTSGAACVRTRVLARGIVAGPIFTYYDDAGARLGTGGVLTALQRAEVTSVELTLKVRTRAEGGQFPARTTISRIRLPNAQIATGGQS